MRLLDGPAALISRAAARRLALEGEPHLMHAARQDIVVWPPESARPRRTRARHR